MEAEITLHVDGEPRSLTIDTRTSLLDALREQLGVTTVKKGCDHGQCGTCTVLLNGRRVTTCLTFAVTCDGLSITTSEGLAGERVLHAVHHAFLDADAFQCGYCTPGQVCSAVGMLEEVKAGWPSAVTEDLDAGPKSAAGPNSDAGPKSDAGPELDDAEIRERMSGNLCRCGAYVNIVRAIREVAP